MVGVAVIPLLISLVLLAASVRAVWRCVTLPRGVRGSPACGSCGYAVADLTSFTCPECGGDLREVGINTPAHEARHRGSLTGALLGWTLLCTVGGGLAVEFVGDFYQYASRSAPAKTLISRTHSLPPESGAFISLDVTVHTDDLMHLKPIDLTLITLDGRQHARLLDTNTMRLTDGQTKLVAWNPDELAAWFQAAGVSTDDAGVAAEVAELGKFIHAIARAPSQRSVGQFQHFGSSHEWSTQATAGTAISRPGGTIMLVAYLAVLLVYALGAVWIVRRRNRLLSRPLAN